ncbi:class I SAM-dependent DNA methyltransferase [Candidatus Solirubrobacter pratensis]|uniref:class I SAM-dependent DNA methyltransferase n=1 Tax=Candidatus Solirubrobacter pratensis TaxID=1298857 RepID=UPI0003FC8892|nr:class I SAM-dependent methyltransferase [Candidatus Solirubrobacter pratensis]
METLTRTPAQASFDAFAPHYDRFTAHHDYDAWLRTLEALLLRHGWRPGAVLDVACGTGRSSAPWLARGLRVTGCDVSDGMLAGARARLGPDVELLRRDMRALGRIGEFALVACLDDAVNYLGDAGDLREALAGMAANLAPGAPLLFDTNTLATYRSFFATATVVEEDDRVLVWNGREDSSFAAGASALATLDAFIRAADASWERERSEHVQRHFPPGTIAACARDAGLRVLAGHGLHLDGRLDEALDEDVHTKAVWVLAAA